MVSKAIREYTEVTTFHGLEDLTRPTSTLAVRLLWAAIIIAAFAYCGVEIGQTLKRYNAKLTTTKIESDNIKDLPSLTVCQRRTDFLGKKVVGALNKDHFADVCNGAITDEDLAIFSSHANILDYLYGEKVISFAFQQLQEKVGGDSNGDEEADLGMLADKYGQDISVNPDDMKRQCVLDLFDAVPAKNFTAKVLEASSTVNLGVSFFIGRTNWSRGVGHKMKLDNEGGICKTFTFGEVSASNDGVYKVQVSDTDEPVESILELKFLLEDVKATTYTEFDAIAGENYLHTIEVTVTKFVRSEYSDCYQGTANEQNEKVNECRNSMLSDVAGCCLCGPASSKCAKEDARCCTELDLAMAVDSQQEQEEGESELVARWEACHEKAETYQPCKETKYASSVGIGLKPSRDDRGSGVLSIDVIIANTDNVLVLKEIPLVTGGTLLGNVRGVLGLFVGGSIMSLVQLILFCVDRGFKMCLGGNKPRRS